LKVSKVIYKKVSKLGFSYFLDMMMLQRMRHRSTELIRARGRKFAVFANDEVGLSINVQGVYEKDELDFLFEFLRPFDEEFETGMAIDVGANVGNHALYFSKIFRKVEAFEPNPATYELLELNSGPVENIVCHRLALGDSMEMLAVVEDPTNVGGARLERGGSGVSMVEVRTLDGLSFDGQSPCFLKLDVEGFESKVLLGAVETLRKSQPFVVFEQHSHDFSQQSTAAIEILKNIGYVFCWQEIGVDGKRGFLRKTLNLVELVRGRRRLMVSGYPVPRRSHSMLLAVPERAAFVLGI